MTSLLKYALKSTTKIINRRELRKDRVNRPLVSKNSHRFFLSFLLRSSTIIEYIFNGQHTANR